jgi:hypothetical protein
MEYLMQLENFEIVMTAGFILIAWLVDRDYALVVAVSSLWPGKPYHNAFVSLVVVMLLSLGFKLIKNVR